MRLVATQSFELKGSDNYSSSNIFKSLNDQFSILLKGLLVISNESLPSFLDFPIFPPSSRDLIAIL
jgi:hypothetical protein